MGIEERFTEQDWIKLVESPFIIGLAASDADMDPSSSYSEFDALMHACGEAQEKYEDNELIQAVLSQVSGITNVDDSGGGPRGDVMEYAGDISRILDDLYPGQKGLEFKRFLYGIGKKVSEAYGEGFLGLGSKISKGEAEFLAKLKVALDL
ncbi:MAG: hypothetical protein K8T10_05970 [Candidatus Eremiobacteraeota bacterium]|nr:hypothetical protein [Candidatus Eremiobacteraeota bacterium]